MRRFLQSPIGRMDGNWLHDGTGKLAARYAEWDNRTCDKSGHIVGDGDQRLRQLGKDQADG